LSKDTRTNFMSNPAFNCGVGNHIVAIEFSAPILELCNISIQSRVWANTGCVPPVTPKSIVISAFQKSTTELLKELILDRQIICLLPTFNSFLGEAWEEGSNQIAIDPFSNAA
jgi:hypothetical protein